MSNASQGANSASNNLSQNDLRRTFIAMLFALVAATIAQQIGELLFVLTGGWNFASSPTQIWQNIQFGNGMLSASLSHGLLALLLLSMSWVMWSKSQAAGHRSEISNVFSKEFIILLTEVFLVVLYFSIAKTMEQNFPEYLKSNSIAAYVGTTSARPEALQLMWVFGIYFVWDIMVDVVHSPRTNPPIDFSEKLIALAQGVATYCSVSLACILAAWIASTAAPSNGTPYEALWGDIALISLLLFFALGKKLEFFAIKYFPLEQTRSNTKRITPPSTKTLIAITILVTIYTYSIMVLTWPPSFLK